MLNKFYDSLTNLISGLGTDRDKTTFAQHTFTEVGQVQLTAAYRGDWIARKVVDIPAKDATREWRSWQADKKEITLLEDEEKRLCLQERVKQALIKSRLYGGAAIVIGVKNASADAWRTEFNPETIQKGGIAYLHTVTRFEITAGPLSKNLLSPYFDQPEYYEMQGADGTLVTVHPSRVIRFIGCEIPDRNMAVNGWGDSIIQAINSAVVNAGLAQQEIASMMQEACVDVIRIPGFMQSLGTKEYRDKILTRFQLAATGKSINRALMLDKDEEWDKVTQSFAQLPELMQIYLNIAAGAGDIPATRLLGQAPGGLNATGDSDVRNYYDNVASEQKNMIAPAIAKLDEALIYSAIGKRPEEVFYVWRPLWQQTEAEKADNMLKKSQAISNYANTGLIPSPVLAQAAQNMLIEDGCLPGLENAIDEYSELEAVEVDEPIDENDPEVKKQFEQSKQAETGNPVTDAAPRALYVKRDVLNGDEILAWAQELVNSGILTAEELTPIDELHTTIAYSRQAVDWMKMGSPWDQSSDGKLEVNAGGPRLVEQLGSDGAIVLMFNSSSLSYRNMDMRERGASWDYEEYQPHVTIGYTKNPIDTDKLESIKPYSGAIKFGPEIFEAISE